MAHENITNFAATVLTLAMTTSSTTLSVTTGTGSLFPTSAFVITVDTEIILVSSRSSDTLTVGTRGYDGSTIAAHSIGANVQLSVTAYNYNHLWQNTCDTFEPDVPPVQATLSTTGVPTGSASSVDNEFESAGSWTLYPTASGSTVFNANTAIRSHLLFYRNVGDNALYTAYVPFTTTGAYTVTCKISQGVNAIINGANAVYATVFVADQTNPTGSTNTGNRFRMDLVSYAATQFNQTNGSYFLTTNHYAAVSKNVGGVYKPVSNLLQVNPASAIYFRLVHSSTGTWSGYAGDGVTYWLLGSDSVTSFSAHSLGFQFYTDTSGMGQQTAIDWIRVHAGVALPPYGN